MKLHVMLIDDDKDELSFLLEALKKVPSDDGFKCTYAASANHATEILKYLVPDYIFIDFNMPGVNGLQLLSSLKERLPPEKSRVYLYSVVADEKTAQAALRLGASGVLKKKYSIPALVDDLTTILSQHLMPA